MYSAFFRGFGGPQRTRLVVHLAALLALFASSPASPAIGQDAPEPPEYRSAEEAYRVGAAHLSTRNYKAALDPLEAALKLDPDDDLRFKIYLALIPAYRTLPELDKFVEACEFAIAKADSDPRRSMIRRMLLGAVHVRGKADELIKRHEEILEKDDRNRTSLYILSEAYSRLKRDPERAAELIERLSKLDETPDGPVNVNRQASLAQQFMRAKKYAKAAELYEQIAPLDAKLAAWHFKEAAVARLAGGDHEKALAAAKKSVGSAPETRSDLLAYFWHRGLADVFLATGQPQLAIDHLRLAIDKTPVEGHVEACKKLLLEARRQVDEAAEKE
jgi:tetratricopeptide (TPR) repeat protein